MAVTAAMGYIHNHAKNEASRKTRCRRCTPGQRHAKYLKSLVSKKDYNALLSDNEVRLKIDMALRRVTSRVVKDGHTRTAVVSIGLGKVVVGPQDPSVHGEKGQITDFTNVGIQTISRMEHLVAVVISGDFYYPSSQILVDSVRWTNFAAEVGGAPVFVTAKDSSNAYVFGMTEEPYLWE